MINWKKHLTHLIGAGLVLSALAAILLGGSLSANTASHTSSIAGHVSPACDAYPPCD